MEDDSFDVPEDFDKENICGGRRSRVEPQPQACGEVDGLQRRRRWHDVEHRGLRGGHGQPHPGAGNDGAMLIVLAGRWLTRPFNLTSTFTLFLEHDAVILAPQNLNEWCTIAPLPSYGRGNPNEALWLFDEILERRIEA
ncbi:hypothetical protein ZIOFF_036729 [Zingiber officinale]|uniref:Uncharacterized protein n=1 Tax=Zingiber officinale TaxID=94328 RepID=A0A8J5GCA9_ZINOF|nr:hypothetical protein ZIOFF_036729 [Zingiber officinale]